MSPGHVILLDHLVSNDVGDTRLAAADPSDPQPCGLRCNTGWWRVAHDVSTTICKFKYYVVMASFELLLLGANCFMHYFEIWAPYRVERLTCKLCSAIRSRSAPIAIFQGLGVIPSWTARRSHPYNPQGHPTLTFKITINHSNNRHIKY